MRMVAKQPFLALAAVASVGAVLADVLWYAGVSAAVHAEAAAWGIAVVLGFVGGWRRERNIVSDFKSASSPEPDSELPRLAQAGAWALTTFLGTLIGLFVVFNIQGVTGLVIGDEKVATSTASTPTEKAPTHRRPKRSNALIRRYRGDNAALVTALASRGYQARIVSVTCDQRKQVPNTRPSGCAVTFAGPSCQLWIITGSGVDERATPATPPIQGRRGSYDKATGKLRCG
jgi:hypothetical protein